MLDFLWRNRWSIVALGALYFAFEFWISWAAFCNQDYGRGYQPAEEYHCILRGPVASLVAFFYHRWVDIFDKPDAYIALFTAVLALFTLALWRSTDKLWGEGRKQLKLARDEFLSTHRPKIRIKHVWLMTNLWHDKPIIVRVIYVNNGATEASVIDYGIELIVLKRGKLLPPDLKPRSIGITGKLPSGISLALPDFSHAIKEGEEIAIRNGMANLFCIGYLHYIDEVNRLRTTAFCRILKLADHPFQDTGRFSIAGDTDYEYAD